MARLPRPRDLRRARRTAKPIVGRSRALSAEEREAIIERLHEEHDLLCLAPPCPARIARALEMASCS
ncbi:MAG: hypothetical protein DI552_00400 [Brevundimonas sp.]|uniref:hypothetical protein n=1 Tax=Brevundimonas sp. TaxID=1871086 RepID=UPI000DBBEAC3|nr:hypothetical protein [Brevundimonas sp.]PZU62197.1 MAG: hypothetical protein DI552_00400 [Brevundimonas sp.]